MSTNKITDSQATYPQMGEEESDLLTKLPKPLFLNVFQFLPEIDRNALGEASLHFKEAPKNIIKALQNEVKGEVTQLARFLNMRNLDFDNLINKMTPENMDIVKEEITEHTAQILNRLSKQELQIASQNKAVFGPILHLDHLKKFLVSLHLALVKQGNFPDATTLITLTRDQYIKDLAIHNIVKTYIQEGNLDQAFEVLKLASNNTQLLLLSSLIDERLKTKNFDKAIEIAHIELTLSELAGRSSVEKICLDLVQEQQIKRAIHLTQTISNPEARSDSLCFICTHLIKDKKLNEAVELAIASLDNKCIRHVIKYASTDLSPSQFERLLLA